MSTDNCKAIYKYDLIMGDNKLKLPEGSIIIGAKSQYNNIVIYILVEPRVDLNDCITRKICCMTTGTNIEDYSTDNYTFIDTIMLNDGSYVVHVLEDHYKEAVNGG